MAVIGDPLFAGSGSDLDMELRRRADVVLNEAVEKLLPHDIREKSDDALVHAVLSKSMIAPLVVNWDGVVANVTEITLDHINVFRDLIKVKGFRATKTFEFSGAPYLWHLRPNGSITNPPRAEVRGDNVTVGMEVREHEGDQAFAHIESTIESIKEYLQRQEAQISAHDQTVAPRALSLIHQRRSTLNKADDLLKKLKG